MINSFLRSKHLRFLDITWGTARFRALDGADSNNQYFRFYRSKDVEKINGDARFAIFRTDSAFLDFNPNALLGFLSCAAIINLDAFESLAIIDYCNSSAQDIVRFLSALEAPNLLSLTLKSDLKLRRALNFIHIPLDSYNKLKSLTIIGQHFYDRRLFHQLHLNHELTHVVFESGWFDEPADLEMLIRPGLCQITKLEMLAINSHSFERGARAI